MVEEVQVMAKLTIRARLLWRHSQRDYSAISKRRRHCDIIYPLWLQLFV